MDEFLLRALLGGLALTLITGPLGCFVVWRRMAYFGDAVAHSALLGVVIGLAFHLHVTVGILCSSLVMALVLVLLQRESRFSSDTLLGILAHGGLSLGLVSVAFLPEVRVDLSAYLFGDILALSWRDVGVIAAVSTAGIALLATHWRALMLMTLHEDIARVEGVAVTRMRVLLMVLIATVVAVAIKLVGMLLITALLIVPAASARFVSREPGQMARAATVIGMLAVAGGLSLSYAWDTPSGPSIVVGALAGFALIAAARRWLVRG